MRYTITTIETCRVIRCVDAETKKEAQELAENGSGDKQDTQEMGEVLKKLTKKEQATIDAFINGHFTSDMEQDLKLILCCVKYLKG